ncbi:MAG: calcium/sodium antiporter [Oscillospiraceae bacterium]|nr:calcium/sodium antiporter [Oscillospiraceae bacterium]
MDMILQLLLLALGFVMLVKGADYFVGSAVCIADRFKIPPIIIGLTIVAMGTSAPEAAVSITSAFQGAADITVGNIVGSNIMNVLVILGLSAAIIPLAVTKSSIRVDLPFLAGITALLLVLGLDGTISFFNGLILIACFVTYILYLIIRAMRYSAEHTEEVTTMSMKKAVPLLVFGMVLIVLGSNFAVDAATAIARILGMSERTIGLTIVALGTSLPELFTSVAAAIKGNADIAVGNIVGSNIFNILFVIGLSSLIIPVPFAKPFIIDMIICLAISVFLFVLCKAKHKVPRWAGFTMLAGYAAYMLYLL